jgi:cell division protein FtsB
MNALQIPGGPELIVFLLVVLFNLAIVAFLVVGAVFLYRRLRGDDAADQADLDALRERVAELEARLDEDR